MKIIFNAALFLFISYNAQCMDITHCPKNSKEDEFIMCMASMLTVCNKVYSQEEFEMFCRQNWNNNKAMRQNFKSFLRNPQPITSHEDAVVGNEFVADMVPHMMVFNKHGWSKGDCEAVARLLWYNDVKFRREYKKSKQTLVGHRTLDNLSEHTLNIIGAFTKRSGKDTLRCVNRTLNQKIISQDELYERYNEAKKLINTYFKKTEMNRLLCYSRFTPELKYEMLEAIKHNNAPFIRYFLRKYDFTNVDLYHYLAAAIKSGNSADILKMLIAVGVINRIDRSSVTVLQHAVIKGKIELVRQLVAHPGVDINQQDEWGRTALFLAVENIKPFDQLSYDMIKVLLDAGADHEIAAIYRDRTPLDMANRIVARKSKKPYCKMHDWSIFRKRRALCEAKSDPKLVYPIHLIQQAIDKKCGI